ncbi:hypothetical protein A7A08_01724 [Methyloligella halotolerans]|uniref:Peptidase C51 domain-containing protein n=1 Tax=Methyloligella halotolerans TaxID=1177755 RepID=A0A1E2S050_9HYPH|nr:hypothetical protein [Methyloligella halotolerans]ODA67689.1 hypothetical protein A7A08_01724 [Methyloligella halotolerans]
MRAFLAALVLCLAPAACTPAYAAFPFALFGGMGHGAGGMPWLQAAMADIGTNPTGWSRQWCGRYMRTVMPNPIASDRAIDWRHYGKALPGPKVGAVAVMPHHVGIVTAFDASSVTLVSGNHSGRPGARTVGVGRYPRSRIVAYRWP